MSSSSSSSSDNNHNGRTPLVQLCTSGDSDSSSEDYDGELERQVRTRSLRNFRVRLDHFTRWNDEEFKMRFRLSKDTVANLLQLIQDNLTSRTHRNHAVTPMQQLLLVLRFCATGCMLQSVGDFVGIHKSTACQIVKKVTNCINQLAPHYIHMPQNQQEIENTNQTFYSIARFPRVVGAIDCTHVKIPSPGGDNAEYFRNRKGYFSLNVQVVGDADLYIRDIVTRWPGSTHDQTILNNSRIQARFEADEFGNSVMLGDSGYALRKYMITPLPNAVTDAQQLFNGSQIRTRNPIERLFGVLKRRFPVLSLGIRLSLETAKSVIIMCAVLHNIATKMNEAESIQDENIHLEDQEEINNGNEHLDVYNFREEFIVYFANLLQE